MSVSGPSASGGEVICCELAGKTQSEFGCGLGRDRVRCFNWRGRAANRSAPGLGCVFPQDPPYWALQQPLLKLGRSSQCLCSDLDSDSRISGRGGLGCTGRRTKPSPGIFPSFTLSFFRNSQLALPPSQLPLALPPPPPPPLDSQPETLGELRAGRLELHSPE